VEIAKGLAFVVRLGAEDFEEEEAGADDDAAVGYVEVGPVVVDDADLEEVDDVVVADAVVEVAEGSAEDKSEGDRGYGEIAAYAPEHAEENDDGDDGEGDENVADCDRRGVFGEHAEGCAGVVDVGDAEDAGDDSEGLAVGEVLGDDVFGDAIEEDHQGGDGENEAAFVARLRVELGWWVLVSRGVGGRHQACGSVVLGGVV
jgi:hypothetical protein